MNIFYKSLFQQKILLGNKDKTPSNYISFKSTDNIALLSKLIKVINDSCKNESNGLYSIHQNIIKTFNKASNLQDFEKKLYEHYVEHIDETVNNLNNDGYKKEAIQYGKLEKEIPQLIASLKKIEKNYIEQSHSK